MIWIFYFSLSAPQKYSWMFICLSCHYTFCPTYWSTTLLRSIHASYNFCHDLMNWKVTLESGNVTLAKGQCDTVKGQCDTVEGQCDTVNEQYDTIEGQCDTIEGWQNIPDLLFMFKSHLACCHPSISYSCNRASSTNLHQNKICFTLGNAPQVNDLWCHYGSFFGKN